MGAAETARVAAVGAGAGLPPAAQPRPKRRIPWLGIVLVIVLVAVVDVAAFVLAGRLGKMDEFDRQAAELSKSIAAQDSLRAQQRRDLEREFAEAHFKDKYVKVREADKATDAAYKKWTNVHGTKLGVVMDAIEACYGAADRYNTAAAAYPEDLFSNRIPARINFDDPMTDCGHAFLKSL